MFNRIKGVLALLPLLTGLIMGGPILYLTSFILTILGLKELYDSFRMKNIQPIYFVGVIFSIYIFMKNIFSFPLPITAVTLFTLFLVTALMVIYKKATIIDLAITYFGIVYIIIPFESIIAIYESNNNGVPLAFLIFVISFSTDIFAYFIGKKFGKRKLIPSISPNKTIEGSVGAIFVTTLITKLYCVFVGLNSNIFLLIAVLGSICSQIGDLFASSIKRFNDVKDFGDIIPGHGGIIDRFDSILFTSLLIFCLVL